MPSMRSAISSSARPRKRATKASWRSTQAQAPGWSGEWLRLVRSFFASLSCAFNQRFQPVEFLRGELRRGPVHQRSGGGHRRPIEECIEHMPQSHDTRLLTRNTGDEHVTWAIFFVPHMALLFEDAQQ